MYENLSSLNTVNESKLETYAIWNVLLQSPYADYC